MTGVGNEPLPDLMIIAAPEDMLPPASVESYSQAMLEKLKEVDFNHSFVILHLVGQLPENGMISNIVRRGDEVHIILKSYSIGPGNYELEGFTQPYQMTSVTKTDHWGTEIQFTVEIENGNVLGQTKHFIP